MKSMAVIDGCQDGAAAGDVVKLDCCRGDLGFGLGDLESAEGCHVGGLKLRKIWLWLRVLVIVGRDGDGYGGSWWR
ncbi:hypothetical protein M0R45_036488 [Rubus argutus]|uniref:Uncharacterized protein n=1 Tax=Rubus argutus TaxID=59490 RepID=A0AAW1VY21_RUBAR